MLKKLRTVIVNDTKITDLEPLSELYALEKLELFSAKIKTLEPLKKLKKLKKLGLSKTKITNVTPLKNCTELSALTIIYSPIKNLSPLEKLKKLENLYFSLHPQFDLSSLRNLKNLKELLILARPKDKIDVQVLSKLTNLETLDFRGIISSLDGLKNLKKLKKFCCAPVYGNDELHRFIIQHPKCTVWHREMGIWNSREHRSYLKIIMKNKKNKL
jgi:internalin A